MWQKIRNEETWKTRKCTDGCVLRHAGFRSISRSFASSLISCTYPETKAVISWVSLHRLYQDPYVCLLQPNCACILSQLGTERPRMFHTTRHESTYNENECVLQICPLWSWRGNCSVIYKKQNLGASCEMSGC